MPDPLPDHIRLVLINLSMDAFMSFEPYLYIGLILLLTFLSAFFSATETAYACINQYKLKSEAKDGNKKSIRILKAYKKADNTLIMSLVGHNLMNVALAAISTVLFMLLFETIFDETIISLISTAAMTIVTYIFGDMVPKIIARNNPEGVCYGTLGLMTFFYYFFYPLILLFSLITRLFNKIFKIDHIPSLTEEDFTNVVEELEEEDFLEENESDIITASFEFADTKVRDILTKKEKMFALDIKNLTKEKLNDIIIRTSYSRIPIYYGNKDKIIGILHVKSYIKAYLDDPTVSILSTLQKPYFVSTRVHLDDMLDGFKGHHTHIAIVKNEDKVLGMVTMEDVLEELVGKIAEPSKVRRSEE